MFIELFCQQGEKIVSTYNYINVSQIKVIYRLKPNGMHYIDVSIPTDGKYYYIKHEDFLKLIDGVKNYDK